MIEESLRSQPPIAAGRDPLVYGSDANLFDVDRAAKDHLAFGYRALPAWLTPEH